MEVVMPSSNRTGGAAAGNGALPRPNGMPVPSTGRARRCASYSCSARAGDDEGVWWGSRSGATVHIGQWRRDTYLVTYLSNVNLRAVLAVLVRRAGGEVELTNEEMYDAMMPAEGRAEPFVIDETPNGIRISVDELPPGPPNGRSGTPKGP
jgi:hypothetical protein